MVQFVAKARTVDISFCKASIQGSRRTGMPRAEFVTVGRTFLPRAEQEESISIFSMYFRSFRDCSSKAACYSVDAFLETMEFHVTFQYAACDTAEHVQICSFIMFHHVSSI